MKRRGNTQRGRKVRSWQKEKWARTRNCMPFIQSLAACAHSLLSVSLVCVPLFNIDQFNNTYSDTSNWSHRHQPKTSMFIFFINSKLNSDDSVRSVTSYTPIFSKALSCTQLHLYIMWSTLSYIYIYSTNLNSN